MAWSSKLRRGHSFTAGGEFLSGSVGSSFVVSVFADRRNASADYRLDIAGGKTTHRTFCAGCHDLCENGSALDLAR
jgi:hypothetical protein